MACSILARKAVTFVNVSTAPRIWRSLPVYGSYSKKKISIAIAGFDPVWCSVCDHPRADSIEILHARKGVAKRTTEIRDLQAKHRHGGTVDAGNCALAADYNYRNIDSIKHTDLVGGHPARSRSVARHSAG